MKFEDINFPVYRKYKNCKSYFKIIHPALFEEIQIIGSKKIKRHVHVVQFPERNFVYDLVFDYNEMALEINEAEYLTIESGIN
ncbi:MAG: hypothetical protein HYX39_01485 [Bacteroidetes bacterium]|nr:hypothetical protein [Bacteroidota bacterium]